MYTYLMTAKKNYYKIGQSKNPEKRLKQLKVSNHEIRLIAYGKGIKEAELHKIYKKERKGGEWFLLRNKDVVNILRLLKNEHEGEKPKPIYIQFGKYHSVRLQDMVKDEHKQYMRWFIKKANPKNEWVRHFSNQLKRI